METSKTRKKNLRAQGKKKALNGKNNLLRTKTLFSQLKNKTIKKKIKRKKKNFVY